MDSNLQHNIEVFSDHYISRFKQLMDNNQLEDAYAIAQEYVCNGEVENDDYQWLCVNYQVTTDG
tara:strand:+ start:264 stop:455 length:192 start_codon:yes stop_codon:yes gene_type:complete